VSQPQHPTCETCGREDMFCARGENSAADADCWETAWRKRGHELEAALAKVESLEREVALLEERGTAGHGSTGLA